LAQESHRIISLVVSFKIDQADFLFHHLSLPHRSRSHSPRYSWPLHPMTSPSWRWLLIPVPQSRKNGLPASNGHHNALPTTIMRVVGNMATPTQDLKARIAIPWVMIEVRDPDLHRLCNAMPIHLLVSALYPAALAGPICGDLYGQADFLPVVRVKFPLHRHDSVPP
jgi:hypothetical protein